MTSKSAATRQRIVRAAKARFARDGFERTTIRAVAADAEIDPAMVMRYFESKEGLFAAASAFDLELPDLGVLPREGLGRRLAELFLSRWETGPSASALQVLLRTATSNEDARIRLREIFERQLVRMISGVVPKGEATLRASLIGTQMLGFALCRYVLRLPGIGSLSPEAAAATIAPTLERYLFGDLGIAAAPPGKRGDTAQSR